MAGVKGRSGPPLNQNSVRHGVYSIERKRKQGQQDRRTKPYKAIAKREREILNDHVKKRRKWHAGNAAKGEYYVERLDAYILTLKHLVRKGKVNPALDTRMRIADAVDRDYDAYAALDKADGQPDLARRLMWERRAREAQGQR